MEGFRKTRKALHRVGKKQKWTNCETQGAKHAKYVLATKVKCEPGRPKLKHLQRKQRLMPRQASGEGKAAKLKVAAILRRGIYDCE